MKNPPTLADACIASALDRKAWGGSDARSVAIREVLLTIPKARRFVLDSSMSRYLADMTAGNDRGGLRQRMRVLDNLRQLAGAPHALTWIEFDYDVYRAGCRDCERCLCHQARRCPHACGLAHPAAHA